jgi:hypothetical protein
MEEYTIRVHNDADGQPDYDDFQIIADSRIDARIIAFCLDGGSTRHLDPRGLIELAKVWTEVLIT